MNSLSLRSALRRAVMVLVAIALAGTSIGAQPAVPATSDAVRDVSDRKHDLVVYGATPGGVACAIRAAREGLDVLLVSHAPHLGGMLTNGLSTMDTLYNGSRAPIYDELRARISNHYRTTYGEKSPQFAATQPGHPKTRYEAHVVERLIDELLAAEPRLTIKREFYPVTATTDGKLLQSVTFRHMSDSSTFEARAIAFADCSYEADLAAVARVRCRVGREAKSEFHEPHAGIIYMRKLPWPPTHVDDDELKYRRRLNLFQYDAWYETIADASTGAADKSVQGYNMRTIVTDDPDNFVPIPKPNGYDADRYRKYGPGNPEHRGLTMPNRKYGMNEPKLVGMQDPYVEGDWAMRRDVTQQHRDATLGLLYFRQHDPSIPAEIREQWKKIGLPKDEFADNGHMPYEIYARETRRIVGREIFTEHDAQLATGSRRAPVHRDGISITEWFLDSHACTPQTVDGSEMEGMVMLKNQTLPGQVSFRTLIPENIDNLLVPVCLSSTHVGWGTIRLEPTWMSIGEAAGLAFAHAKRENKLPANIDTDALVRDLAQRRVLLSFFNDIEGRETENWYAAAQYLGTQGYFGSYDLQPQVAVTPALADAWIDLLSRRVRGEKQDPTMSSRAVCEAEKNAGGEVRGDEFATKLDGALESSAPDRVNVGELLAELNIRGDAPLTRADGCRLLFALINRQSAGERQ